MYLCGIIFCETEYVLYQLFMYDYHVTVILSITTVHTHIQTIPIISLSIYLYIYLSNYLSIYLSISV